ncbi:bifunctional TolB-family protein/amidohydrolase [Brevundimonas denitrificans]|uniref:Bifunctional TolB-family protein/amidohydrolase n=1 Tax=Brevundimonas denitrificans TaxID=1443434 RepID=A0ABQ6BPH9_9CAUL|nr:amidohydrolase family protein [Brevundimonas denitrificans]GLS02396.1 bifunctional TolB-family protein/amidohydrolase [Brevundimonas denitrificans]
MKRAFLTTVALLALACPAAAQTPEPVSPIAAPPVPGPVEPQAAPGPVAAPAAAAAAETPKWDVQNPPGPSRDIPIDVTRGTWMSLDVSPDGQTIVFDLLGDIYVMPVAGGEARAIASGVAWDMQPKWSPDGRHIAFTSDRAGGDNIWIMDADGSNPTQVSKETFRLLNQPEWSPDGQFIVARKHFTSSRSLGAGELWMYHRSGGGGVQMTERRTQQKDTGEPAFSPDGRYIYFSDDATPGATFEYSKDVNDQIYIIRRLDRETGEIDPYITGPGGSIRPTPSPDGKSIAFIRRVRYQSVLYVMDIESGRETPVFTGLDRDLQETWAIHGVYPAISWTPDNRSIVFWADGRIQRVDVGTRAVAEIPFHVADTRRVQDAVRFPVEAAPDTFDVRMIRWARPSPDGTKVVFEALGNLWIRDLPTGTARRLTRQNDHFELYPNWSRDGRSIVYTTWDDQEFGSIRVVPVSGGAGRVVTSQPGHYVEPTFSPDGRTIVYRTVSDGFLTSALWSRDPGVYRIPAAGGEPVFMTDDGSTPQFGAANDRVFLSDRDGDKQTLISVNLDGEDERTHLTSEWASEFAVSPDGNWIGWTERFNAYVAPFVAAGRPITISADGKSLPQARVTRDAGDWLSWSGDSRRLQWSLGPELFTRDLNQAFTFVDGAPDELPAPDERGINLGFTAQADVPEGRMALTGARIITMNGAEVIENGVIVIEGNRIVAIGPLAATTIPAGTPTLDMAGKTIMPGLVDAHWHGSMGSDEIIPEQSWVDYASLAFGVTTIHNPSADTSTIFAHSELARTGRITAPRIFSTGTILYGANTAFTAQVDDLDDALSTLRRMQAAGAWSVKSYNQPRRDQRQQIIEAARQLNMMVVPEGGSLFQHNMSMIVDGHTTIEHSIPLARLYDDVHQLWRQTGVAYNPTLVVAYGGSYGENYWYQESEVWNHPILTQYVPRRILDARARRPVTLPDNEWNHISVAREATRLSEQGVSVSIGAHGQREGLAAHWELWSLAQGGMAPIDVIRAGTLNGARSLGLDRDIGSLEVGKLADMVVLDQNPLENIRNTTAIAYTIANGRVYDSGMNEVAPRQRARAPFWFAEAGGEGWAAGATEANSEGDHGH